MKNLIPLALKLRLPANGDFGNDTLQAESEQIYTLRGVNWTFFCWMDNKIICKFKYCSR